MFEMTIDGASVTTEAMIAVINPVDRSVAAMVPNAGQAELDRAVEAARRAFPNWRDTPYRERQKRVTRIGEIIAQNEADLARLEMLDGGKPAAVARPVIGFASQWAMALSSFEMPEEVIDPNPARRIVLHHEPIGVVGALSPWNFPIFLAVWKLSQALLAGCTIVLKPSPFAPLAVLKLGELIRDELPPGVVNIIVGDDFLGPLMAAHPGFDKISFTGSTATGRKVMDSAAPTLKHLTLELGGNDPAIVFPDVDLEAVAQQVFWSAVGNSGQACIATKRIYVQEEIYDTFLKVMHKLADSTKMGRSEEEGVMLGPVQNEAQFARVQSLIEDCRRQGYAFHQGPAPEETGFFIPVTVVDNPPPEARIVREEQFGPILPVMKFSSEDEVISLANDTDMGLTATVWTKDMERAARIARKLEVGTVWINEASALSPMVPFGGHKQSGLGVENGLQGILAYTQIKAVTANHG